MVKLWEIKIHSFIHSFVFWRWDLLVSDSYNLGFLNTKGKIFNSIIYVKKRKSKNKLAVQDLFCFSFVYNVINQVYKERRDLWCDCVTSIVLHNKLDSYKGIIVITLVVKKISAPAGYNDYIVSFFLRTWLLFDEFRMPPTARNICTFFLYPFFAHNISFAGRQAVTKRALYEDENRSC